MKTQYVVKKRAGYLYVIVTGEYSQEEFLSYPKIVADECAKANMNKVLVNALSLAGANVPTMDRFFAGENIAKHFGAKIKLAVAWPKEYIDKFTETVAVNRGAMVLVVGDVETAEKWLLENP